MFSKKLPLYLVLPAIALTSGLTFWITSRSMTPAEAETDPSIITCSNSKLRLSGYKYIRPLLLTETACEAELLMPVKVELMNLLNYYKGNGTISNGSIYLRELNEGEWIAIEEDETYLPGSLMKVPELITFMKMNERQPGLLNKKVLYNGPIITDKNPHYLSKSLEAGKTYSVKELLYYMIVYSDNNATVLLNNMMDLGIFVKTFTDLGLKAPDVKQKDIPITAVGYSRFMRSIFNATYLSADDSEFCAELLSQSEFRNGIRSGVPSQIPVAHKFGEAGDANISHFSESGIIYINNNPYLLTVMTKGKQLDLLPGVAKEISRKVFEKLSA